jgi:hypothetical protein
MITTTSFPFFSESLPAGLLTLVALVILQLAAETMTNWHNPVMEAAEGRSFTSPISQTSLVIHPHVTVTTIKVTVFHVFVGIYM